VRHGRCGAEDDVAGRVGHNGWVTPTATSAATVSSAKVDAALAAAGELARSAAEESAGGPVGAELGVRVEGDRLLTHTFEAAVAGYTGWYWAVTLARASRSKTVTVDEVALLPGDSALLAPEWVPWNERLRPGDLGPGDLLPAVENDPRLVPAYLLTGDPTVDDDPQVQAVAWEVGLGRERVLSRDGILDAADRWLAGDHGPHTAMARNAPGQCGTCGFLVGLTGALRAGFGVCANEISGSDGDVVSVEFGCGAHSQAEHDIASLAEPIGAVYDDGEEILANDSDN
jgi:hypothetical protein